jgi:hypothetical protein
MRCVAKIPMALRRVTTCCFMIAALCVIGPLVVLVAGLSCITSLVALAARTCLTAVTGSPSAQDATTRSTTGYRSMASYPRVLSCRPKRRKTGQWTKRNWLPSSTDGLFPTNANPYLNDSCWTDDDEEETHGPE